MGHHRKHREEADKASAEGSSTSSSGRSSSRHRRHRHAPSPPPPLTPVSPPLPAVPSPKSASPSPVHIPLLTLPALPLPALAAPSPLSASPTAPGPIERALQTAGHSLDYALSTALSAHSPAFASRLGRLDAALVRAGEEMDRTWPGTAERVGSLRRGVGRELERWEAARALWVSGGDVSPYTPVATSSGADSLVTGSEKEKPLPPLPGTGKGEAAPDEVEDDAQSVMANPPLSDNGSRSPSACVLGDHKRHDDEPSEASEDCEPCEPSEEPPRELCRRHRL
ncbi:uncharacterized protein LOC62_02G003307 [Vanrija pseudolonga]|uniref:Uncharacterized protein n=1 Tax=Vanrija pseudolonga TaxID=143232 RepID=A0AAF0Y8B2_9TREE|nr:hypothetical protein LOC62_02G003307 [Vanrija pseudolonga]